MNTSRKQSGCSEFWNASHTSKTLAVVRRRTQLQSNAVTLPRDFFSDRAAQVLTACAVVFSVP